MDDEERQKADLCLKQMDELVKETKNSKNRCVNFSMDLSLIENEVVSKLIWLMRNG